MRRCYSDLVQLETFRERFEYLSIKGNVGEPTFAHERWMNQRFYHSREWADIRDYVITRDEGFDLGCRDHPIAGKIMVHHICPLTPDSLASSDVTILSPEYLISCSIETHNAIHYGREPITHEPTIRKPFDTCPWKDMPHD